MTAVIVTASAPESRVPEAPVPRADLPAASPPLPVALHRSRPGPELAPRADRLAGVVARRYRVAQGAAAEVVHAAFREGVRHGLDPMLILAVIAVESRFNPIAESEQGAVGLMQVVPRFHMDKIAALGAPSILLPEANIALGTRILKDAIRRGGNELAGLQLYNGAVDDETQAYANRVLQERRRLEAEVPAARNRA
ncbi:MAG: transglycosylase SLT domain-containing protein [Burkholderiales bacterium]